MENRFGSGDWSGRGYRLIASALCLGIVASAQAQDLSENRNWQFSTPQDLAARSAALELMMKQRAGVFAPPVYHTTIDRQYNCSIGASATGNSGAQTAVGNAPNVVGPSSAATGNASTSQGGGASGAIDTVQNNGGAVGASASGAAGAFVDGSPSQTLNSEQRNLGAQSARVDASQACSFGVLN